MRKIVSLAAVLSLALSAVVAAPASGTYGSNISLFDGDGATGTVCLQMLHDYPSLTATGCAGTNWNNRAESIRSSLYSGDCAALYTGENYTGSLALVVYGQTTGGVSEISSTYDNTVSSFFLGTTSASAGNRYCKF